VSFGGRLSQQPAQAPPELRPAIEWPGQLRVHFHDLAAEDVAAIIRQQDGSALPPRED
jgi:hypothetical protein